MDFPSSLKKSFKSHGSYKHSRRISAGAVDDELHEHQPILSDHQRHDDCSTRASTDHREVIVKVDAVDKTKAPNGIWRESSYDFWTDGEKRADVFNFQHESSTSDDPPSKLIGQFLNRQRDAGGEISLDMDLEMDELRDGQTPRTIPVAETPTNINNIYNRDLRVSFQALASSDIRPEYLEKRELSTSDDDDSPEHYPNRRRFSNMSHAMGNAGDAEVLRCTSVQRRMSILRTKTQSRLMDPPDLPERKSERVAMRSGMLSRASGMLGKVMDDEEEDSLFDEDFPEDYRTWKLDALTLLQWISLVLIVTALICTLTISKWKRMSFRGLHLWKWEVLVLVLICGRLVSGWAIKIIVFFIERNFLLRKRVLYFVYGIRKAVQNCTWLGLVLIAWHYLFDDKVDGTNNFLWYVNKILVCFLLATLLWLVKTLLVKVLASSFHVSTFFDRIQESLFNQYVIEMLSGPPVIEIQNNQEEMDRTMAEISQLEDAGAKLPPELKATAFQSSKSGRVIGSGGLQKPSRGQSIRYSRALSKKADEGITIDHLHRLNPKNISAWNMKRLMNLVRYGVLSTLDEQIRNTTQEDESNTHIRSEFEAKLAARKIFRNVARPRSKFIYLEDLMRFLRQEEALKTMNLVEGSSEYNKFGKSALKNWVVNAFRERRALALTLNDTKTAVRKLHHMVNVIVGIIIVVICLVILEIATSKVLLFATSQIVVVAFIFGNTCKTIFEAIIFLFVMHPFDVGDRCEIDGVQMIVEEMNIMTTVFLRFDNQKIIFPNSTLSTRPIGNFYRSPDMGDSIDFYVHIATPTEKIAVIKQRITTYIENKKDHWYSTPAIVLMNLEELNKLKMSVWLRHKINHQDMGEKWTRRALLIEEMVRIFKDLDIEYRLHPIDINIRAMPPINSNRVPSTWTASS